MKKLIRLILAVTVVFSLFGCGQKKSEDDKVIKVGATLVPHAEILKNVVADKLAKDGWKLEVVEFNDYVTPNTSLESGELDANYFQTLGYLNGENENRGLHLVAAVGVHIEPMGIYSSKHKNIADLPDGAKIGVPNDTDNYNRAIDLLIAKGLLNGSGVETELNKDAEKNPHGFEITPIEAASLPRSLDDLDAAVINGNYALEAGLPEKSPALTIEEFNAETTVRRTNYIAVKAGNESSEKIKALVAAIVSDEVKKYIEDTYKGAVIPSFVDAKGNPVK
ncbi:MAG: MetQ/NlpA family ABC transporter substrate-binding protein [Erysipelotrichaceae bacterium]|nr:MetQ/NlpA family ABC transporter substrate-binding protein [Erysipelotrichaceae bacterium]MBR2702099.1 MetQ/NlpA family ABC transporter substrate-binding protein [Erysipelotrichaceae bacterium]MBR2746704.1 MetQ/NlpA family ABC transporter substrate-binding protein [Erysipelotrichaceae bacterium]